MTPSTRLALEHAREALQQRPEWEYPDPPFSRIARCPWCHGRRPTPGLDEDHHGQPGHTATCRRHVALAMIAQVLGEEE